MNRFFVRRVLVGTLALIPLLGSAQPLTEPSTVFLVLTGPNTSALYHRQGCPILRTGSSFMPLRDAKAKYFQPHCLCLFGHEGAPPCDATFAAASSPRPLIGLSREELVTEIGLPSSGGGEVWYYDRPDTTARITFDKGVVAGVVPATFDPRPAKPATAAAVVQSRATAGNTAPRPLIGLTDPQVRARLGQPSLSQGNLWNYDTAIGTLTVYFKNGIVSEIQPSTFDLSIFPDRPVLTSASSGPTPSSGGGRTQPPARADSPPAGATAQCRDGTYSYSASRRGTYSGHGGVARWL